MPSLHARLQRLEDRLAIADLVARYGPAADSGAGAAMAGDWTEDARYSGEGWAFSGKEGIAAITDWPEHRAMMREGCAHLLGPHAIEIEGDSASARGHSLVLLHDGEAGWKVHRASANHWQFVRTEAGWRIARRQVRLLDGGEEARLLLLPPGTPPRQGEAQ